MLKLSNVSKSFGKKLVLDDISFQVNAGEIVGFLGENGAGKTTAMRIITGFLQPNRGSVSIFDKTIDEEKYACQQEVGYLPEGSPLYGDMRVRDFLEFVGSLKNVLPSRVDKVSIDFQLEGVAHTKIEQLSKGYRRRVGFASALLADPRLLLLDEPLDGLDPNQKKQAIDYIKSLGKDKIILLSTHSLEDLRQMCDRVILLHSKKILLDEPIKDFISRAGQGSLDELFFELTR